MSKLVTKVTNEFLNRGIEEMLQDWMNQNELRIKRTDKEFDRKRTIQRRKKCHGDSSVCSLHIKEPIKIIKPKAMLPVQTDGVKEVRWWARLMCFIFGCPKARGMKLASCFRCWKQF